MRHLLLLTPLAIMGGCFGLAFVVVTMLPLAVGIPVFVLGTVILTFADAWAFVIYFDGWDP